jgi:hypothetical protein
MFSLIPRHYQRNGRINACLRNEYTNKFVIPKIKFLVKANHWDTRFITATIDLELLTIDSLLVLGDPINNLEFPEDFKTQNKYEVTLLNANEIIYKGKMIVLEAGTDIQNYDYGKRQADSIQITFFTRVQSKWVRTNRLTLSLLYGRKWVTNGVNNVNFKTYKDAYDDSTYKQQYINAFVNYVYEGLIDKHQWKKDMQR